MLRTIRRAVTVVAVSAVCAMAAAGGAGAAEGDATCVDPVVVAGPLTRPTALVVGETYGSDVANATGHCLSYQGGSTAATLSVEFEYQPYDSAGFLPIPSCSRVSVTRPATTGVHVIAGPTATCTYLRDSPAAGRPHRVHAVLTHPDAVRAYHGYSAVYPGAFAAHSSDDVVVDLGDLYDPSTIGCCGPEITTGP